MYMENLALEIAAIRAGLKLVKPAVLEGHSGVEHKFTFMATSGSVNYAIDVYDTVTTMEILRTYAKKIDTAVTANVVSVKSSAEEPARSLAREYNMRILRPEEIDSFFQAMFMKKANNGSKEDRELSAEV